jgi:membrane fusion protein (multidrug efflux system)
MGNGRDAMSEDNPAKVADTTATPGEATTPVAPKRKLFPRFLALAAIIAVAVGGFVAWRHAQGVSTDDAFVRADIVQVPAEVAGRVTEVIAKENVHVAKGDVLLRLDATEYELKVAQAKAALASAEADARRAHESAEASRSDIHAAELRLKDARREEKLQTELASGGASVQSNVDRASSTATVSAQSVSTAQAALSANLAALEAAEARVPAAQAALALAERDLALAEIRAPQDGTTSRIELQPGELVQRGQPLLAIVADERYVVANFKETDLDRIAVGAPVKIEVDAYPDLDLEGTVESISPGTGAVFSLLPPDNATGNFIKVVQRVPVRIRLEGDTVIPAGLSATVKIRGGAPEPHVAGATR